ncbi:EF-hand domain-containing protein [Parahaliea sp. F7430]|uniref:EF-hand domain-containing protein n=1 Tax=Sediminihaliea albiluteola TaxID=2758564 RepID=A0A7W2TTQ3_9GAMM|nr:EF-hand domain-containing protein [Sediminihaliea albiluteola]MBA6411780.1 EF-hand domain-containing protein [Sediminihaliea albiluteola]
MPDNSELRENFDYFDSDNNGAIDKDEFANLLDALGADMSAEEVVIGFEVIDTNGNGRIEFDEFLNWWTSR